MKTFWYVTKITLFIFSVAAVLLGVWHLLYWGTGFFFVDSFSRRYFSGMAAIILSVFYALIIVFSPDGD